MYVTPCHFSNKVLHKFYFFIIIFFYIHLGYSLYFTVVCLCHIKRGVPPPSGGKVGKNRSTRSKTTVRSKRVGPLGSKWGPFTWFPQWYLLLYLCAFKFVCDTYTVWLSTVISVYFISECVCYLEIKQDISLSSFIYIYIVGSRGASQLGGIF